MQIILLWSLVSLRESAGLRAGGVKYIERRLKKHLETRECQNGWKQFPRKFHASEQPCRHQSISELKWGWKTTTNAVVITDRGERSFVLAEHLEKSWATRPLVNVVYLADYLSRDNGWTRQNREREEKAWSWPRRRHLLFNKNKPLCNGNERRARCKRSREASKECWYQQIHVLRPFINFHFGFKCNVLAGWLECAWESLSGFQTA